MSYDTASLRKFLTDLFSAADLTALLFDYFRDVHDDITPTMPKSQQIQMLLEHVLRQGKMEHLLGALAKEKPGHYRREYFTQDRRTTLVPEHTPVQRNPRQIFISHAHQDADFAHRLANNLEAHGYDIWIAPDSIRPGEKWVDAINRGLDESGIFVVALTPNAVSSRWVKRETNVAIEMETADEIAFLPLQVKACRLPALWRAYQRIPFRAGYGTGFNQLLSALNPTHHSPKPTIALPTEQPTAELTSKPTAEPTNEPTDKSTNKSTNKPPQIKIIEPEPPRIETPPDSIIWPKDGKEMVLVPAGEFLYGKNKEKVTLPAFYIDKTPVTNAEYKLFLDANPDYKAPRDWDKRKFPNGKSAHPVARVSWHDAQAYADWVGKLLPTEQQWEKAARGTDGRDYPWGIWQDRHCNTRESGINTTSLVGQFSPQGDSPYGCVDMSGNVWEWMSNWYDTSQKSRALRGGSWFFYHRLARVSNRHDLNPNHSDNYVGFRLVAPVGSGS